MVIFWNSLYFPNEETNMLRSFRISYNLMKDAVVFGLYSLREKKSQENPSNDGCCTHDGVTRPMVSLFSTTQFERVICSHCFVLLFHPEFRLPRVYQMISGGTLAQTQER